MKPWGVLLYTLILVPGLVAFAPAQDNQTDRGGPGTDIARPALVVDEFTHDFGEVKSGKALRWAFKIRNVGKADLLIQSVTPG